MKALTRGIRQAERALILRLEEAAASGKPAAILRFNEEAADALHDDADEFDGPPLVLLQAGDKTVGVRNPTRAALHLYLLGMACDPDINALLRGVDEGELQFSWGAGWLNSTIIGRKTGRWREERKITQPKMRLPSKGK